MCSFGFALNADDIFGIATRLPANEENRGNEGRRDHGAVDRCMHTGSTIVLEEATQ